MKLEEVQKRVEPVDSEIFVQYEKAKDYLFVRLCNIDKNGELLEQIPHTDFGDMALTYRIALQKDENKVDSVVIDHKHLEKYGVSKEQLHQDALINSRKMLPPKMVNLEEPLKMAYREWLESEGLPEEAIQAFLSTIENLPYPMYALSNEREVFGAGTVFYPGMMDELGEFWGCNYFIFPSSIHEVIVCRDDGSKGYRELEDILVCGNEEFREENVLSNTLYHYDIKDRVFEKAADFEQRKEQEIDKNEEKAAWRAEHKPVTKRNLHEMSL